MDRKMVRRKLLVQAYIFSALVVVVLSVGIIVVRMTSEHWGSILLWFFALTGSTVSAIVSFRITDDIHNVDMQIAHIHYASCRDQSKVLVVDRRTHAETSSSIGPWTGSMIVVVLDDETTECACCKSRTIHVRGQQPRLEVVA